MNRIAKRKLDRIDLIEAGINPLVCCISGGGSSSTTTQKADPWAGVQPYLQDIFSIGNQTRAANPWSDKMQELNGAADEIQTAASKKYFDTLLNNSDSLIYGNRFNPQVDRADYQTARTRRLQADGLSAARQSQGSLDPTGQLSTILSGGQVNPYLQSMNQANINDSLRGYQDSMDMLTQNMLPNIRSGATSAGQYGGSRQGIAEGLVGQQAAKNARDLGISAMDSGNQMYGNAYQQMTNQQYDLANNLNNQAVGYEQFGKGLEQLNNQNLLAQTQLNNQSQLAATGLNNQSALNASQFGLGQMLAGNEMLGQANQLPMQLYQQLMGLQNAQGNYDWDQLNRYAQIIQPGTNFQSQTTTQSQNPGGLQTLGTLGNLGISAYMAYAL